MSFINNIKEFFQTWKDYKAQEKVFKNTKPDTLADREFLPAALEIQETPPSPIGRTTIYILCTFLMLAVLWATIGKVDIVSVGQGSIIPSGRTKVIQPFETGVVSAIHIKSGQTVKAGDLLVEMDITQNDADRIKLEKQLEILREKLKTTEELYNEGASSKFELLSQ